MLFRVELIERSEMSVAKPEAKPEVTGNDLIKSEVNQKLPEVTTNLFYHTFETTGSDRK